MSGQAKLANHEHIHRSAERPSHLVGDRDAAPRKGQRHQVVSSGDVVQLTGEDGSGVSSIGKPEGLCGLPWSSHV